jgi:hypothetical protein
LIAPASAIYLDAVVNTKETSSRPLFKFIKTIYVKYPEGGKIAELLKNKDVTVDFSADSMTPGVSELITKLNENLKSLQSNAVVTDLQIRYVVHLEGNADSAVIDYNIVLTPTITNLILRQETGDAPTLIDSRWRGMSVNGPVIIHDSKLGDVDISSPIGFFKVALPDVYSEISATEAESFLSKDLLDARTVLSQPLANWLHLFDPLGQLVETEKFGYKGEKIPITTFSMGESSFREGQQREKVETVEFSKDKKYTIESIQYQSIGVIQINGIVRTTMNNGIEYFGASSKAVQGYGAYSSGNFPVTIIYSMTGMAVLGAVGFFYWSNKKANRESEHIQTGIDPKYLRSINTSEAAGGYHTNRGEAELIDNSVYEAHQSVYGSTSKLTDDTKASLQKEFTQEPTQSRPSETRGAMPKGWKPEN